MKGIAQLLENALLRCCYSTLLLLGVCSPLYAQTNPYQIDDRCYNVYADALSQLSESYSLVLSDSMARLARRYNDKKAEVLAA
ncbi:MAG: hypothetical protein HUJ98_10660, partial [Bacteroidaceae bacterium]|nr:hypothetical protein [Bacteroidaceae bacterium]